MATTGAEILPRPGGNLKSLSRRYTVDVTGSSTPEEDVGIWVEANSPSMLAGLVRNDIEMEEYGELADQWLATAKYGELEETEQAASGSVEYRFNFQAQGIHVYQSLETIASYARTGETARDFKGAVNVVSDGGKLRTEGYQIDPPAETFSLNYYPVNAVVTAEYQLLVADLCGKVNDYEYRGCEAGSLMLVRVSGGVRTSEDWSIEFGFGYVPNQLDIPVGDDITVPSKDGLDLLWPFYGEDVDGDADALIKTPLSAYVERVWYRGNFDLLALP
jgi:hypothetical protein